MAEIEITLPTVQYGNIKITATPEEWGLDGIADAPDVGVWAAIYLNLFQQGFKKGAAMDVDAHLGEAKKALDEGLGGVTELSEDDEYDSATEAKEAAQARTSDAPWGTKVDAKPKPWETGSEAPKASPVVSADW